MKRKLKKNSWHQLKEEKCPKCNSILMKDLFEQKFVGCACGFNLANQTKELLNNRDDNGKL